MASTRRLFLLIFSMLLSHDPTVCTPPVLLKLGNKRQECSERNYYIISPRVIIKATIIMLMLGRGLSNQLDLGTPA